MIDYPMDMTMVVEDNFDIALNIEEDLGDMVLNIIEDIEMGV